MRKIILIFALAATQPLIAQSALDYKMTGSPEDGLLFEFESFPLTASDAVVSLIESEATKQCGSKEIYPSSYRVWPGEVLEGDASVPGILRYERLVLCIDPIDPGEPAPADFEPTANDRRDALAAFEKYYRAFDTKDFEILMPMRQGPVFPRKVLLQEMVDDEAEHGNATRTAYDIDWVVNPAEYTYFGVFADVLYRRKVSDTRTICGAARMYRRAEGDYLFSRDMTNSVDTPMEGDPEKAVVNPCLAGSAGQ